VLGKRAACPTDIVGAEAWEAGFGDPELGESATGAGPGGIQCNDMVLSFVMRLSRAAPAKTQASAEAVVVARAQRGDHAAFEALVRRHRDSVLGLARRMVGDPEGAQDVAQEAFVKAFRELHRFRGEAAFGTWLYRIALNEARVYLRTQRRRQVRWERQRDEAAREAASPQASAEDEVADEMGPLAALLQELPEKQRGALALFYLQELSVEQIGQTVGAPSGTVKAWLSRGREKLRRLAEERGLL